MTAPTRPDIPVITERYPAQTGGLDIFAFILAFLLPLLGLILGIVGISEAHKLGRKASGLAVAAVIIGGIWSVIVVAIIIIAVAATAASSGPDSTQVYLNCLNNAIYNGGNVNLCVPPPS